MRILAVVPVVVVSAAMLIFGATSEPHDPPVAMAGTVTFNGEVPAPQRVDMAGDDYCVSVQDGAPMTTPVVVDGAGRVADVIVYVKEGVSGDHTEAEGEVLLDQTGCQYAPRVVVVRTGQTLRIRNSDDTFHNVHVSAKVNRSFNIGQPIKGMQARRDFGDPEIGVDVKCDVHGWMQGYMHVLDHPFYGVTGADGAFDLGALPPGTYVVEAWHAALGSVTESITVTAGQPVTLELHFE